MGDYKMEESVGSSEDVNLDRLSELPDSLIHHILSFLPIRDAISTTFLSKHWKNLWTTLPCLNFTDIISEEDDEILDTHVFRNFVNGALIIWKGNKLLKFIIDMLHEFDKSLVGDMDMWVGFALENKVEELNIGLTYDIRGEEVVTNSKKDVYWAPQSLNSCSWIRKLSLEGCNLQIHGIPAWNQLKSLSINGYCFSNCLINRILLGAPQLEEFELRLLEINENLNIQSTSLKKLNIDKYIYYTDDQPSLDTVLTIYCPNLETLEISGEFYTKCLLTNVSSLMDARLDFTLSKYYVTHGYILVGETMRHIFLALQHVKRVTLSYSSIKAIAASQKKNLFSPLPNVVFLKVQVDLTELVEMVNLLEIFPNLKMLVIEDSSFLYWPNINAPNHLDFEANLSKSFLLQLKIVEIISRFNESSILRCIEFLLKHGNMLKELVIRTKWILPQSQAKLLDVAETVLSMPRSSPTVKVIFNNK